MTLILLPPCFLPSSKARAQFFLQLKIPVFVLERFVLVLIYVLCLKKCQNKRSNGYLSRLVATWKSPLCASSIYKLETRLSSKKFDNNMGSLCGSDNKQCKWDSIFVNVHNHYNHKLSTNMNSAVFNAPSPKKNLILYHLS